MKRSLLLFAVVAVAVCSPALGQAQGTNPAGSQSFLFVLGDGEVSVVAANEAPPWDQVSERAIWVRCGEFKFKFHKERGFSIECHGNVQVASKTYHARAATLLIRDNHKRLEFHGDADNDVQLFKRTNGQSPISRLTARSIVWWPEESRLKIEGSSTLEVFEEGQIK